MWEKRLYLSIYMVLIISLVNILTRMVVECDRGLWYFVPAALLKDTLTRWSPSGPGAISQQTKLQDLVVKTDVAVRKSTKEIILREPSYFEGKFIKIVHKSNCIFGPTFHCSLMKPHSPRGGSSVIESAQLWWRHWRTSPVVNYYCRKLYLKPEAAKYHTTDQTTIVRRGWEMALIFWIILRRLNITAETTV